MTFAAIWDRLAPIGRTEDGYQRLTWSEPDIACRHWFREEAASRDLEVRSAMLFVRNPTGVSHDPAEHADLSDCLLGVQALAAVLGAV